MKSGDMLIMSGKERKRKVILEDVIRGMTNLKDAAPKMEVGYRQAKRILKKYKQHGDIGLVHRSRGKVSSHAYPVEFKTKIIDIYKEKYLSYGPTFSSEKFLELDNMVINPETLRLWLLKSNLWNKHRRRKSYRQRRERRQRFGELLQIDGSIHAWFGKDQPNSCLLNIVDDATGITLSQMDTGETCYILLSTFKMWVEKYGVPKAVYVDLKSLYVSPRRLIDNNVEITMNVFERVCRLLNVEIIKAYSPQAKGRVERNHGVYQDRFVKELKLRNIITIERANKFLIDVYLDNINDKFAKPVTENAHCSIKAYGDLNQIFCWEYIRQVHNDFTIQYNNEFYQLEKSNKLFNKQKVIVRKHLNNVISIWSNGHKLIYKKIPKPIKSPKAYKGISNDKRSEMGRINKHKSPWCKFNSSWLKKPMNLWTSPSEQLEPFGTCGKVDG